MRVPRTCLTLLVLSSLVSPCAAGDNWPQFRGPAGNGHSDATGLPLRWSETENIRWKTAIHDKGWSSPVIWGDQVWMTTAREDGKELFAVCVDRDSGKIVYDMKVFDVAKPDFCIPMNSYASSTPVIEAGRVYVHFGSPGTACIDTATGKVLWTRRDLPCNHWRGAGSSPILYDDLLILTFDGHDFNYMAALNKHTGKTVWKKDRDIKYSNPDGDLHKAYCTPSVFTIDGKPQLVSPSAEVAMAYNPRTGEEIWRATVGGMNVSARPLYGHGRFYITTAAGGKQLVCLKTDGRGDITNTHIDWTLAKTIPTRSSLLLIDDLLYMVSDSGIASCVNARTGEQLKQQRLGTPFSASPIHADGRIYFFSEDKNTYVIEPSRELKVLATNKLDEGCMASPAVAGKALFVRTKTHLYRIEQK
jgi:outer membrane protein assembly factor BamB